ncbi:MAG: redoxin domain-containing protein [Dehalococcoidia bacterium]
MSFQRYLPHFEQAGVAVFAISPDPVPHLAEFAFEEGVTFPLLSDDGSAFIRRLGILNDLIGPNEPRYGIPFPGVYALSADGTVHRKYFYRHYRERIAPLGILLDAYGLSLASTALPTARGEVNGEQIVATLASEQLTPFEHTPLSIQVAGGAEPLVRIDGGESITVSDMQERASAGNAAVTAWLMASTLEPQELTLDIEVVSPAGALVRLSVPGSIQGINRGG